MERKKWNSIEESSIGAKAEVDTIINKEYHHPQIVLTRVDKLEEQVNRMIQKRMISLTDKERKIRELQDRKIEDVCLKLSVPRHHVHFIENYHDRSTDFLMKLV